jgi:hypothetical protein
VLTFLGRLLVSRGAFFMYGTLAGPVITRLYPGAGSATRDIAKSVIKQGIAAGAVVQKTMVSAKESFEDIAAEARSELFQAQAGLAPSETASVPPGERT